LESADSAAIDATAEVRLRRPHHRSDRPGLLARLRVFAGEHPNPATCM
jgi:hypothetical protein